VGEKFAVNYENLSDDTAKSLLNADLSIHSEYEKLRQSYLSKFRGGFCRTRMWPVSINWIVRSMPLWNSRAQKERTWGRATGNSWLFSI